ncbi:MAG: SDR family oxidoreductase [Pirellulaceae bacterium]
MSQTRPVSLITGAGTGVGRACAVAFAMRGFDVVINYSRSEAEAQETATRVRELGATAMLHPCDVADESGVKQMLSATQEQFGRLDVLVNNAAMTYFIPGQDLEDLTEDKWDRMLAVNLKGPFFCIKAAVDLLRQSPQAAVVNVSSVAGLNGRGSSIGYAASKGALNTLTKSMAQVLAPQVRVNAVLPGPIDSRWIRESASGWDLDEMTAKFPLPRASQPSDIAAAVVYLALDTNMTTGQLLTVDGGGTL